MDKKSCRVPGATAPGTASAVAVGAAAASAPGTTPVTACGIAPVAAVAAAAGSRAGSPAGTEPRAAGGETTGDRGRALEDAGSGELVRLAQSGDAKALGDLVRLYHPRIFAYLVRLSGDRDLAKDLSQEVLLRCCTSLGSLRQPGSFRPWIYRMAYRAFLDEERRQRRRPRPDDGAEDLTALAEGTAADGAEQSFLMREESRQVRAALLALKPQHRNVLVLRFYHELPVAEIARVTGVPVGTVKSRLYYAMASLKAVLEVET